MGNIKVKTFRDYIYQYIKDDNDRSKIANGYIIGFLGVIEGLIDFILNENKYEIITESRLRELILDNNSGLDKIFTHHLKNFNIDNHNILFNYRDYINEFIILRDREITKDALDILIYLLIKFINDILYGSLIIKNSIGCVTINSKCLMNAVCITSHYNPNYLTQILVKNLSKYLTTI